MSLFEHPIDLRALDPDDATLLERATLENLNWAGQRYTLAHVRATPGLAQYARFTETTFGVVAVRRQHDAEQPLGVAWATLFPAREPGYGFVAADVPEAAVGVFEPEHGIGLGRRLLAALASTAAARGHRGLSLSAEAGDPARRLAERVGFSEVPAARPGTMFLSFD